MVQNSAKGKPFSTASYQNRALSTIAMKSSKLSRFKDDIKKDGPE
jgi:hypothetical protein